MAKKKNKGISQIPFRLNILFFVVFVLFSVLIVRLGLIQIVQGDDFERDLEETSAEEFRIDAPRGLMYDRNGELVVDNELTLSLTYTNRPEVSEEERIRIAKELSKLIEIDEEEKEKIPDRDKKDYWIATHPEEAQALITKEDRQKVEEDQELYKLQLKRIGEDKLQSLEDELEVVVIWREMISGYYHTPERIKKGITEKEAHQISERLDQLPGVDIIRDANRNYIYKDIFPSFFGQTGSIPREHLDEYLAKGYDRSDEVGTSFLEEQYEETLRGKKGEVYGADEENSAEESKGSRGNDLVLSVDMALQKEVTEIINQEIGRTAGSFINKPEAYVVMMDPNTGEILAIAGYDDHLGTVSSSFEMGSTVKGATVLIGLQEGVVTPNTVIYDSPLDLPYTPTISSVSALGPVNYLTALERSSNIYMARIAMEVAGYRLGVTQSWNTTNYHEAYDTFRYYYSQFGLGTYTGIDLPSETIGIKGATTYPGNLLYLSFGQFDTYTPLQLAQYISTVANGGYRMKPRLVKEIREPNSDKTQLGPILQQFEPKVLNRVEIAPEYIEMVQQGFWRVINGSRGTARSYFVDAPYTAAGKTGTAEITERINGTGPSVEGNNQAFVAYAPYENPEVTVAVIVPGLYKSARGGIANTIARRSLDAYFELKESRPGMEGETTEEQ